MKLYNGINGLKKNMVPHLGGDFTNNLLVKFDPIEFKDFIGALTKLYQKMTMREYQIEFEKLANCTEGLDDAFFSSCFISGLKE